MFKIPNILINILHNINNITCYHCNKLKASLFLMYEDLHKLDISNQLKIIFYSITFIAFVNGFNYFTSEPSLLITNEPMYVDINDGLINKFYISNNIMIPNSVNSLLNKYGNQQDELKGLIHYFPLTASINSFDFLNPTDWSRNMITKLERDLNNYQYKVPQISTWSSSSFLTPSSAQQLLKYYKKKLTDKEYYTFLISLLSARRIQNFIIIQNNSNMNIFNLHTYIPYPLSNVTGNRSNNILDIQSLTPNSFMINDKNNIMELLTPKLDPGKSVWFQLRSIENKIDPTEITYTFNPHYKIDSINVCIWFIICLIIISFLFIIDKRKSLKIF